MSLFEQMKLMPSDPILGLAHSFKEDERAAKINLGVGVYRTEELNPPYLESVKRAGRQVISKEKDKEYLPIAGHAGYLNVLGELVFGKRAEALLSGRIAAVQTLGGTGALRLSADLIKKELADTVFLSNPTWANHAPLYEEVGFKVSNYPYYDAKGHSLKFEEMSAALRAVPRGSALLLQTCCHNPTGVDLSEEQWKELSTIVKEGGLLPIFDAAYLGFNRGFEEDAGPIRYFVDEGHECFVCVSLSKNFGLYKERVGALFVVCSDSAGKERVLSQLQLRVRRNYSNPPAYGALVAYEILRTPELKDLWSSELDGMRKRIVEMRIAFAAALASKIGGKHNYQYLIRQSGMFSFCGLNPDEVLRLRSDFGIYMPSSGRINIAGLSRTNIDDVAEAIASVI
ncbi:aspartate/tyrosine/aromatic aminotransferase [Simkania negevensis]|uniref:Aspartate/tyrosine/aromatic aminotransferase n=1 Tax=Simkania negevensis TaxID=83561 RepID=A0ABS3ARB7_9BACT|nr:aspartate/tyrosine/aromatic aminotransferase [Simkania negevensis]